MEYFFRASAAGAAALQFLLLGILSTLVPAQEEELTAPPIYRLKPNDQVFLDVYGEPDMTKDLTLTIGGEASLPFVGATRLAGLTLKEAEEKIIGIYKGDYLIKPLINLNLVSAAEEQVQVVGAVGTPGPVAIPPNTTLDLLSAIEAAGGLGPQADSDRIQLQRNDFAKTYRYTDLTGKKAALVMLKHGDRVTVPTSPFANKSVSVLGEVKSGGSIPFPPSGELDLTTLIALSGGVTELADPARITVKRGERIYSAPLATAGSRPLSPGDIVTVPKSLFVGKTVTMMGQVGKPGPLQFPLDGKLDLLTAIALAGGYDRLANKKKIIVTRRGARNQTWRVNAQEMAEGKVALLYLAPGDQVTVPVRRF